MRGLVKENETIQTDAIKSNQTKSNQSEPDQTKSNHYRQIDFFVLRYSMVGVFYKHYFASQCSALLLFW